jgi:hypothetical protein
MKIPEQWVKKHQKTSIGINTLGLLGISLTWGHMLNLVSLWFLPLTIFCILAGYGSEVHDKSAESLRIEV